MAQLLTWSLLFVAVCYTLPSANGQGMSGRPRRPCGRVCMTRCEFGNVIDSRGCSTCRCNPAPFPPRPRTRCPRGSSSVFPRRGCSSFSIFPQRCPRGSFCVPDPADGPGVCCRRRYTPAGGCRPFDPRVVRCARHWDQCNSDRDCWGIGRGSRRGQGGRGGTCCPGPCGRECQRPGSSFPGGYPRRG